MSDWGAGSSGTKKASKRPVALNPKIIRAVRDLVAAGNTGAVRRVAKRTGLSDQNRKALVALSRRAQPEGFFGRLGKDISDTVTGTAKGLPSLGLAFAKEVTAVPRLAIDAAQGDEITGERLLGAVPGIGTGYSLARGFASREQLSDTPLSSLIGTSFRNTAERVAHPSQAVEDYSQRPFSSLVEDVGNVAIVGGVAAKGAKAAGLTKTATAAEKIAAVGNEIANLPFLPVSRSARLANKGFAKMTAAPQLRRIMEPLRLTPEMRDMKRVLQTAEETKHGAANQIVRAFKDQEKILPAKAEQEAMYLIGQDQAQAIAKARATLPPERFAKVVENLGDDFSPEGVQLAADVIEGKNPELAIRIEKTLESGRAGRKAREASYLERGPASRVEQTETGPLSGVADPNSLEAAPARLRPVLETNRLVKDEINSQVRALREAGMDTTGMERVAADLPDTLALLEENGINPEHFINPRTPTPRLGTGGQTGHLPKVGRLDEARRRTGKGAHDMTIRGQARAEIRRTQQVVAARAVNEIAEFPWARRAGDLAEEGQMPSLAQIREQGFEAWDPSSPFEVAGAITPNTVLLPRPVFDAFRGYFEPKRWEPLLEATYDKGTRAFKTMVLPLSPSWNVANAVGNAFMAVFSAGVDPFTLAKQIGKVIGERRRTGEWSGPDRLFAAGSTHETLDWLGAEKMGQSKLRRAVGVPARAGYKINETVDNIFRSAVFNAKKAKGYSDEAALKIGLNALGDFSRMTPFERSAVRRAIPFYAWLRHMTQTAVRLPIEHPYRTSWTLSMSNTFKDQDAWETLLPSFMQGFIPLGGDTTLSVGNFMPFSNPFAIKNVGQNLAPQLKFLASNVPGSPLQGHNFLTGRPYTRPPGTGRYDEFGRPQATAPSILEQLRQLPPQMRAIDQIIGRKDVARYETGDPVLVRGDDGKRHPIKTPRSDLAAVLRYAGMPTGSLEQLQAIVDSIIARQVARWKEKNPQEQLGSGSGGSGAGSGSWG